MQTFKAITALPIKEAKLDIVRQTTDGKREQENNGECLHTNFHNMQ